MGKEEERVGKGGPARVYEVGRSQEAMRRESTCVVPHLGEAFGGDVLIG